MSHDSEQSDVFILKMNGERERFDPDKLRHSLNKAGAPEDIREQIVSKIEGQLRDNMTTHEIYKQAYSMLEDTERPIAARYSLRRALQGFGPSGFPFETFVGEVFKARGYEVQTGVMMKGTCTTHEVDMVATNENEYIAMEVKFHNSQRVKSDLKVALYIKARFDDILNAKHMKGSLEGKKESGWLLTNTKFTKNALKYADCAGLTIVSWGYPEEGNLQDLVEETGLHPVTCLTSLPDRKKTLLVDDGNVLCKDIVENPHLLSEVGMSDAEVDDVVDEAALVCQPRSTDQHNE